MIRRIPIVRKEKKEGEEEKGESEGEMDPKGAHLSHLFILCLLPLTFVFKFCLCFSFFYLFYGNIDRILFWCLQNEVIQGYYNGKADREGAIGSLSLRARTKGMPIVTATTTVETRLILRSTCYRRPRKKGSPLG